jgi:hypothetical protein
MVNEQPRFDIIVVEKKNYTQKKKKSNQLNVDMAYLKHDSQPTKITLYPSTNYHKKKNKTMNFTARIPYCISACCMRCIRALCMRLYTVRLAHSIRAFILEWSGIGVPV